LPDRVRPGQVSAPSLRNSPANFLIILAVRRCFLVMLIWRPRPPFVVKLRPIARRQHGERTRYAHWHQLGANCLTRCTTLDAPLTHLRAAFHTSATRSVRRRSPRRIVYPTNRSGGNSREISVCACRISRGPIAFASDKLKPGHQAQPRAHEPNRRSEPKGPPRISPSCRLVRPFVWPAPARRSPSCSPSASNDHPTTTVASCPRLSLRES